MALRGSDYREILNDPDIDLVDICLPTDRHHEVVIESLRAGKPTLVEKPIAVDLDQASEMVRVANECQVPLLVAHVLPFFPEFQYAAKCVTERTFGKDFQRLETHSGQTQLPAVGPRSDGPS